MGCVLVLRRTSEACRSSAMDAPRTLLVLGARLNETVKTGESRGNSTSSHREESGSAGRARFAGEESSEERAQGDPAIAHTRW